MTARAVALRHATPADIQALRALIRESAHALSDGFYSPAERDAAIQFVFGVDTTLIADGTYFVAESVTASEASRDTLAGIAGDSVIVGCGGWSKRRTLFGGDQHKDASDPLLDPRTDAARIRAFFVAPHFARQGIGGRLMHACAEAAFSAGFRQLELMATLPGVPLYVAYGFTAQEDVMELAPNGVRIPFVRMHRALPSPTLSQSRGAGAPPFKTIS